MSEASRSLESSTDATSLFVFESEADNIARASPATETKSISLSGLSLGTEQNRKDQDARGLYPIPPLSASIPRLNAPNQASFAGASSGIGAGIGASYKSSSLGLNRKEGENSSPQHFGVSLSQSLSKQTKMSAINISGSSNRRTETTMVMLSQLGKSLYFIVSYHYFIILFYPYRRFRS
jgi:hypothetical protein